MARSRRGLWVCPAGSRVPGSQPKTANGDPGPATMYDTAIVADLDQPTMQPTVQHPLSVRCALGRRLDAAVRPAGDQLGTRWLSSQTRSERETLHRLAPRVIEIKRVQLLGQWVWVGLAAGLGFSKPFHQFGVDRDDLGPKFPRHPGNAWP